VGLGERKDTMSSYFSLNIASQNQKVKPFPQNPSNSINFPSQFSLHSQFSLQIKQVKEALSHHLKPYYLHFHRGEENLTFKAIKRGTQDYYQFFVKSRFKEFKGKIEKFLKIEKGKNLQGFTNGIFLTYTFDCGVKESWGKVKRFSKDFKRVKERLKYRGIDIVYGIRVIEAQRTGKAHLHLILILSHPIEFRFDSKKRRGYVKREKVYQELRKLFDLKYGFLDLQAITTQREAVSYLSKYFTKGGEIETILKKEDEGLREDEVKRLLGLYFMILFKLRQFSVFGSERGLDKAYNNNFQKSRVWERLQGEALREWIEFLASLGLGDLVDLGVVLVRGSPGGRIKVIF
jgi:hypothetical protein